jgi:hypothetical protein
VKLATGGMTADVTSPQHATIPSLCTPHAIASPVLIGTGSGQATVHALQAPFAQPFAHAVSCDGYSHAPMLHVPAEP